MKIMIIRKTHLGTIIVMDALKINTASTKLADQVTFQKWLIHEEIGEEDIFYAYGIFELNYRYCD